MQNDHKSFPVDLSLTELRKQIDKLDEELLTLLNKRSQLSIQVGQLKKDNHNPIYCPEREQYILSKLQGKNSGPLPDEHLLHIYTEILSSSRYLQHPLRVACLGPAGTFSYMAGQDFLGKTTVLQPLPTLEEVFAAVVDGKSHLGIIPLENSLQGSVGQSLDLFMLYEANICAEFFYRIRHSLISTEHSLNTIKKVYSHPQALAQCSIWLKNHLPKAIQLTADSTAKAAELAAKEVESAAISHSGLARLHNLNILAEGIEAKQDTWTRFVLIRPNHAAEITKCMVEKIASSNNTNNLKTTLLFSVDNKPGALATILNTLQKAKLNLSKLESRPSLTESWTYRFFADVEADLSANQTLLLELKNNCHLLRVLGIYNSGGNLSPSKG